LAGLIAETYPDDEFKEQDVIDLCDYEGIVLNMYRNSIEKIQLTLKPKEKDNEEG
jgi:hypothetical protein